MTEYTRPATWEDVKRLATYLAESGVEYALIGGYAIAAHGYNRFTEDVDILVNPSSQNTARWIEALARLPDGASRELIGQESIFEREAQYAIRINDEFTVDVKPAACGHAWAELKDYIEIMTIDETTIRVMSLEGLLLTKQSSRDPPGRDACPGRNASPVGTPAPGSGCKPSSVGMPAGRQSECQPAGGMPRPSRKFECLLGRGGPCLVPARDSVGAERPDSPAHPCVGLFGAYC